MDKRQARKEFKARKTPKGIYAVRCTVSGEVWVSSAGDLNTVRNGVFFMLRNAMHHNKPMQEAWNKYGDAGFEFEVLETFDEDMPPLLLRDALRDRQKHWIQELSGAAV